MRGKVAYTQRSIPPNKMIQVLLISALLLVAASAAGASPDVLRFAAFDWSGSKFCVSLDLLE